jgi:hypothetical protein
MQLLRKTGHRKTEMYITFCTQSKVITVAMISAVCGGQLTLHRNIFSVSPEIYTKLINTICKQKVQFLNDNHGGT